MNVQVYKPENETLNKYINNFYILEQTDNTKELSYLTFPNPNSTVSIIEKVSLKHFPNKISVEYNPDEPLVSDLTFSYKHPILVSYKGIIKEVSICFKPLGINSFIDISKDIFATKESFLPYPDFEQKMTDIITLENNKEIISQLENYLLFKVSTFDHTFLYEFVNDISSDPYVSISELSKKYGISQKTLIKHSKMYLKRTPSEFKKVVRFHKSLHEYFNSENKVQSFTNISHAVNFFDQAHMIKDFKTLTGYTPRSFFKNLNSLEGELNWIFL